MLPPDQALALVYGGARERAPFSALLQFDGLLGKSMVSAREPILAQIRLAWWREEIEKLSTSRFASDPLLSGIGQLAGRGETAKGGLIALVNAWETFPNDSLPTSDSVLQFARDRGGALFSLAALAADVQPSANLERAGTLWALVDFARRSQDLGAGEHALMLARNYVGCAKSMPRILRPFAVLTRYAERDSEMEIAELPRPGSPRRIVQALGLLFRLS